MESFLKGYRCSLEEISEKHFKYVIKWRNDPLNNKYINQPFLLDYNLQVQWFEKYVKDDTQILYILIDDENKPFGTFGLTDMNYKNQSAVDARLITDVSYRGSEFLFLAMHCFFENVFKEFDVLYTHSVKQNKRISNIHKILGYKINPYPVYPNYLTVSKYEMEEKILTKEYYMKSDFLPFMEKIKERF